MTDEPLTLTFDSASPELMIYAVRMMNDPVTMMTNVFKKHGKLAGFAGNSVSEAPVITAYDPAYNKFILSDPARFYTPSLPIAVKDPATHRLMNGLVSMNGAVHRHQRRLMMPAFHRKHIQNYADDMIALTEDSLQRWQNGQVRDIAHDMHLLTLNIVNKTLFGRDHRTDENVAQIIQDWMKLITNPMNMILPLKFPGSPARKLIAASGRLEYLIRSLIAEKRNMSQENADLLTLLIHTRDEDGNTLTDDDLVGQATILFIAGHETTANALTWTLMLLAQHPEVYEDVLAELETVLNGNPPELTQLERLPLLDCVIKESMRLLSPTIWTVRVAQEDFELDDYHLKAGTGIMLSHYITHRLPDLYPEPYHFKPERWEQISPSAYEYMPFSAGARMCIGATFAMMEIKLVLATLLQRFRFTIPDGTVINRRMRNAALLGPKAMPMKIGDHNMTCRSSLVRGNVHDMVMLER